MQVEIYGMSDDLIEVEGDMQNEFGAFDGPSYLHFGDGTVIEAEYAPPNSDYRWLIRPAKTGPGTSVERLPGTYSDEGPCDKLVLVGDLKWVECWGSVDGPTREDIEQFLDGLDASELTTDQAKRVMAICRENER